jgi:hypothetical protein
MWSLAAGPSVPAHPVLGHGPSVLGRQKDGAGASSDGLSMIDDEAPGSAAAVSARPGMRRAETPTRA